MLVFVMRDLAEIYAIPRGWPEQYHVLLIGLSCIF